MATSFASMQAFSPNVGIERIIASFEGPGASVLPQSTRIVPSEGMTGLASLRSLYASAWDNSLTNFLQPRLSSRELLIPGILASRLRQAKKEINELARQKKSRALRDTALMLEEDEDMKELLDTYRNLLLQG